MRSGLDHPRVYGAVRTLLIGYGIATLGSVARLASGG
jgi:hypothetical protein